MTAEFLAGTFFGMGLTIVGIAAFVYWALGR